VTLSLRTPAVQPGRAAGRRLQLQAEQKGTSNGRWQGGPRFAHVRSTVAPTQGGPVETATNR
jgi:hypothetical protein